MSSIKIEEVPDGNAWKCDGCGKFVEGQILSVVAIWYYCDECVRKAILTGIKNEKS